MAGKPKQGIDYAGWSVAMFDNDEKIDLLLDASGWDGFGIYFYLCQRAFGGDGYFYKWGYASCASTARKMGGGIGSGTIKEVVDRCLRIGLFDKGLFDRWGILTSKGIQRSFWRVLEKRRVKAVYKEFWLLDDFECPGLEKNTIFSELQDADDHLQDANDVSQDANDHKYSIVKNSIVKTTTTGLPTGEPDGSKSLLLSPDLLNFYRSEIGKTSAAIVAALTELTELDGEKKVMDAIQLAGENGHRNLAYIRGILKNWRNGSTKKGNRNAFTNNYTQRSDVDWDAIERELAAEPIKGG